MYSSGFYTRRIRGGGISGITRHFMFSSTSSSRSVLRDVNEAVGLL